MTASDRVPIVVGVDVDAGQFIQGQAFPSDWLNSASTLPEKIPQMKPFPANH